MTITIHPNYLQGTLTIPSSKSYMQRACAAALLKGGTTTLNNIGISNDDKAALDVIQQLGARLDYVNNTLEINSNFGSANNNALLNLGESGLGLRMFTPITALLNNSITINGHGSLTTRPMHFFDEILPLLNVDFKSNNGFLPFTVKGPLQNQHITVDGSLSSQFLTGLLFAFSYNNTAATITVQNLTSKPYIDITLDVIKSFGLNVPTHSNYKEFVFTPKTIANNNVNYTIESDWSSASFMLVAAAINGNCNYKGLNVFSVQADKKILEALQAAGAIMSITKTEIEIKKSSLKAFHFDATECPDLFPPLVALAANAIGTTSITGVNRLAHKESNRGLTLQQEFAKLGVTITLQDDLMLIEGKGNVTVLNEEFTSHNDHRIAMALAVAIQNTTTPINIENAEAVKKSYPNFYEDLASLVKK
jgi:3-phosphoshikimate 1-carboxyvinyltransferase